MGKSASALEVSIPESGIARDLYDVSCTATMLYGRALKREAESSPWLSASRHAVALHAISGRLHRMSERECNEDLTCRVCGGEGHVTEERLHRNPRMELKPTDIPCPKCRGEGTTTGPRKATLRRQAQEIAEFYGLRAYFQTDPRGCALYLIPQEIVPDASELVGRDVSGACSPKAAEYLRTPEAWIEANYNHGHAVVRVGR